jgi:hypothetical protein
MDRAASVAKRAPQRRARIREIINAARRHPAMRPVLASRAWDQLAFDCEQFVSRALLRV